MAEEIVEEVPRIVRDGVVPLKPKVGSGRIDISELGKREESNSIQNSKAYQSIKSFIRATEAENLLKIESCKGMGPSSLFLPASGIPGINYGQRDYNPNQEILDIKEKKDGKKDGDDERENAVFKTIELDMQTVLRPEERFKRTLKKCGSSLLHDLQLYDSGDADGASKRVAHMYRSGDWFNRYEIATTNNTTTTNRLKKNMSCPNYLTFHRDDAPLPGSRRVFHRNTITFRENGESGTTMLQRVKGAKKINMMNLYS